MRINAVTIIVVAVAGAAFLLMKRRARA